MTYMYLATVHSFVCVYRGALNTIHSFVCLYRGVLNAIHSFVCVYRGVLNTIHSFVCVYRGALNTVHSFVCVYRGALNTVHSFVCVYRGALNTVHSFVCVYRGALNTVHSFVCVYRGALNTFHSSVCVYRGALTALSGGISRESNFPGSSPAEWVPIDDCLSGGHSSLPDPSAALLSSQCECSLFGNTRRMTLDGLMLSDGPARLGAVLTLKRSSPGSALRTSEKVSFHPSVRLLLV